MAAINALGTKQSINSKALDPLLWIDQPYVVRDATARVFEQHGCDEVCVSSSLYALHAMWAGQLTIEMQLYAKHPYPAGKNVVTGMVDQTEQRYLSLVNKNPCITRTTLRTTYPADGEFVEKIQKSLGPC